MTRQKRDFAPWLLLPFVVLTLGSVTLLAPHEAAQAAPPVSAQPTPKMPIDDDGDGDELLEHWGDPQYSREARLQLGGIAAGFLLLSAASAFRRSRRRSACEVVFLPGESGFLSRDSSAATDFRKAA